MRRVYVESPYGSNDPEIIKRNIMYARACVRDCILRGEAPFASHLLYTQDGVLRDEVPDERALGMEAGFVWGGALMRRLCTKITEFQTGCKPELSVPNRKAVRLSTGNYIRRPRTGSFCNLTPAFVFFTDGSSFLKGEYTVMNELAHSFMYAFSGLRQFVKERNAKIMVAGACVAAIMVFIALSWAWRAILVIAAASVFAVEMMNSAIERLLDYVAPAPHPEVKYIKDVMAGASLVVCLAAFVVCVMFLLAYFGWQ